MLKLAATFITCVLITGCSDKMDPLKPFMSCSIAAAVLNQDSASRTALAKSVIVKQAKGIAVSADDAIKLHNEIREGWLKHGKSKSDQLSYLITVFNSPECLSITESGPLNPAEIDMSKIADPKTPAS